VSKAPLQFAILNLEREKISGALINGAPFALAGPIDNCTFQEIEGKQDRYSSPAPSGHY
jgi:hypothetical protein